MVHIGIADDQEQVMRLWTCANIYLRVLSDVSGKIQLLYNFPVSIFHNFTFYAQSNYLKWIQVIAILNVVNIQYRACINTIYIKVNTYICISKVRD